MKALEPFIGVRGVREDFWIWAGMVPDGEKFSKKIHSIPFEGILTDEWITDDIREALAFSSQLLCDKFPELYKEWWAKCREEEERKAARSNQDASDFLSDEEEVESWYNFLREKGQNPYQAYEWICVPLSSYLRSKHEPEKLELNWEELKEGWGMEFIKNLFIRLKRSQKQDRKE